MNEYYKDELPRNTINTIMNLLRANGITPRFSWLESISSVHSVIVSIPETTIAANGKGSSKDLACASGLAELVERLENFLHFRLSDAFLFSSDEVRNLFLSNALSQEDLSVAQQDSWFNLLNIDNTNSLKSILTLFANSRNNLYSCYTLVNDPNDKIYIPYSILDYSYGSNGMAAGNTSTEALVQAISEIIERHVAVQLLSGKNCRHDILDITDVFVHSYPQTNAKFEDMSAQGYAIRVLDLSLNEELPVIGLLIVNQNELEYFLNLGCHPDIDVAVQRALNEFLQGRKLGKINDMTLLYADFSKVNITHNIASVFHAGTGTFPVSCLALGKCADHLPQMWLQHYTSNEDILANYKHVLCDKFGKKIYVRYQTQNTLKFPVVHVVIPDFSEVTPLDDLESLQQLVEAQQWKFNYISFIKNASSHQPVPQQLIDFLEEHQSIPLNSLYHLPIFPFMNPLNEISSAYILMCLHVLTGNYHKGYLAATKHLEYLNRLHPQGNQIRYKIVTFILYMLSNNYSHEQVESCLLAYGYPQKMITEYLESLTPASVFKLLPHITCPDCNNCALSDVCCFKTERNILTKLST